MERQQYKKVEIYLYLMITAELNSQQKMITSELRDWKLQSYVDRREGRKKEKELALPI
jgi:hypothetical protein